MAITHEKIYHIDFVAVSPHELIQSACDIDSDFANDWCRSTSMAATILKQHGREVGNASEIPQQRES